MKAVETAKKLAVDFKLPLVIHIGEARARVAGGRPASFHGEAGVEAQDGAQGRRRGPRREVRQHLTTLAERFGVSSGPVRT